ncbi:EAL domain-containing protein [Qipengyuania sp. SS22]|uniref:putative bifunctional diguanylate cyclase/phosphodiesterase n=1 Tax=Qipengyuania sp. SS22 TaxID=2979461 RepID=UPI0021E61A9F|nr:EAL domain-containing protein [Qipengyuania sp. SS22]UYH55559.1 EAL domain-containing protein [Qipengyuania sp. SS22]
MIGFESDNEIAAKFSRERIKSVRNTIHIYYLTIIAPFIGIAWVTWDQIPTRIMAGILVLAVVTRFRHWVLPLPEGTSEDVNPVAARVTGFMVVLLSCSQTFFYLSLALGSAALGGEDMLWLQILSLALLAALTQGAALTGIIFASRVIFFCFVLPLVATVLYLYAGSNLPASVAVIVLTVVSLYLAETSYKMQLCLFKAQFDADAALVGMERTNLELVDARRTAQHQAEFDNLTGVRNRLAFIHDVEAKLDGGQCGLLAVIDLDRFKPINDLYGHHAGDVVLRHVARRLQRVSPAGTIVGRLGGDEFGIFIGGSSCPNELGELVATCDDALVQLRKPMRLSNALVSVGGCAGARLLGEDAPDVGRALRDADAALYVAKRESLETTKLFDGAIQEETRRLHAIEADLMEIGTIDRMSLAYQPILNLKTGELTSFEALARWNHPIFGEVSPAMFIPAAERLGRIGEITLSLLSKALDFAADWTPPCRLSFNLSAAHICSENAAAEIVNLIERRNFPPDRLQFEITETAMLVNFEVARRNVELLRNAGCRIALDDFGAGFASLVYLREIKFDKVKIDGSLIRGAREPQGRDMLRGVIKMIEAMKLESVAEYIATVGDRETALELGAQFGQGFYLGRPLDEAAVLALLGQYREPNAPNIHRLANRQIDDLGADACEELETPCPFSVSGSRP